MSDNVVLIATDCAVNVYFDYDVKLGKMLDRPCMIQRITNVILAPTIARRNLRFLSVGCTKDFVSVVPMPQNLNDLRRRITKAVESVSEDILARVWTELEYRVNICRATNGAQIKFFWRTRGVVVGAGARESFQSRSRTSQQQDDQSGATELNRAATSPPRRESSEQASNIYCWLSTSAPTARPSYVMPGGGKKAMQFRGTPPFENRCSRSCRCRETSVNTIKAVFPTLALHDHEKVRATANEQDRRKKFQQSRGKSESKDSPEKEKSDPPKAKPVKTPSKSESVTKCPSKELPQ
ncbi:uncharacterized protein [Periplaneta americana]|uniref:uncharacterized protein n=1 Tax=Periplaneta americana TaxID=6978 RepID=UPI0037E89BB9